jgi:pyridoxal phosphate enzyme (YggS family)
MGAIAAALQACQNRISSACNKAGRSENCAQLVAVSKTFPVASIREAYAAGQRVFGESYLQEALPKLEQLADLSIEWHFIGPLQSNKTRQIAAHFDWVHSLARDKIAHRLSEQRPAGLPPLNVCIQVNVSGEASKSGISPDATLALAHAIAALPNLRLRGFMAIPEPSQDPSLLSGRFRQVAELLQAARISGLDVDTLSMGMSADLEAAIQEGATLVRVGTAIFGARPAMENNQQEQVL